MWYNVNRNQGQDMPLLITLDFDNKYFMRYIVTRQTKKKNTDVEPGCMSSLVLFLRYFDFCWYYYHA